MAHPPLLSLSLELRQEIYEYVLFTNLSHLCPLRLVNRQLYFEISPIYYKHYTPKIECWGFDGLENEHPTYSDPYIPPTDYLSVVGIATRRALGLWTQQEKPEELDRCERHYYRSDSTGPRNYAWLLEMPPMARQHVQHVEVFGPVPQKAYHVLGPPPRHLNRKRADWYAPQKAVMKWIRANMPGVQSLDYCFIRETLYSNSREERSAIINALFGPDAHPPCRRFIFPRSSLSYALKEWAETIVQLPLTNRAHVHIEIWIAHRVAEIILGRAQSCMFPTETTEVVSEVRAFRAIEGVGSVKLCRLPEGYDEFGRKMEPALSRLVKPEEEMQVELGEEGAGTLVWIGDAVNVI